MFFRARGTPEPSISFRPKEAIALHEKSSVSLENAFLRVYQAFKLDIYSRVYDIMNEQKGTLNTQELSSLEVIHLLNRPTIGQYADFLRISRPNATYKISCLVGKGYLNKMASLFDKRECRLELTQKYYDRARLGEDGLKNILHKVSKQFSEEELALLRRLLDRVSDELEPAGRNQDKSE